MYDPDFEAGRQGQFSPPNGDWGKLFAGSLNRDPNGQHGTGCAILVLVLGAFAILIWALPLIVGASAAVVTAQLYYRERLQGIGGWKRVLLMTLASVVSLAVSVGSFYLIEALLFDFETRRLLLGVVGDSIESYETLLAISIAPGLALYLALMWVLRPLKQGSRSAQILGGLMVASVNAVVALFVAALATRLGIALEMLDPVGLPPIFGGVEVPR